MKAFPRDIEPQTLSERHIGIESELQCRPHRFDVPPGLRDKLDERGLLYDRIGHDGGGREFRTNPISVKSVLKQVRGRKYLTEYFEALKAHTNTSTYGGTHIHISILDKDHPNMESNATALAMAFHAQFQKIAGRKTHWASRLYCYDSDNPYRQIEHPSVDDVRRYVSSRIGTRGGRVYNMKGSMLAPTYHKTLEFRGGKGSNDSTEVLAWVEFLNNVVKAANRKSINGIKFGDLLQGERIAAYVAGLPRHRRITKADLNATVNEQALC